MIKRIKAKNIEVVAYELILKEQSYYN